jgi:class 3 adenylate cyclase
MHEQPPASSNVVAFPLGRSGTPARRRRDQPGSAQVRPGIGPERRVTVLRVAIHGSALSDAGREALEHGVDAAVAATLACTPSDVALDGSARRPVLSAEFEDHERTARAITAALQSREAVERIAEEHNVGLEIRVGVHAGNVVDLAVGGDEPVPFQATGPLFTLVERLQAAADPGQILLSSEALAQVTAFASVHQVDDVTLNRHGEQRRAYCLLGLRTLADA